MSCCTHSPDGGYVPLEDFLPYVTPYVLGVPDEIAAHATRLAAIELARASNILRRTLTVETLENVGDYQIDIDEGYVGVSVRKVSLDGTELSALRHQPPRGSGAVGFVYEPPRDLLIYPCASTSCECGIELVLIVTPGQDTCQLDRILYDQWAEGIGYGAVARIKEMKDGSWYDPPGAARFEKKFQIAKANSKAAANRGYTAGPMMMKTRRFV